ncbi:MAG: hypothetical protein JXR96_11505 [Deltaproteobacteria bacterium]|nr:hypothetical protein [Deltaproteobacteria bacterium]
MRPTVRWLLVLAAGCVPFACEDKPKPVKAEPRVEAIQGAVMPPAAIEMPEPVIAYAMTGDLQRLVANLENLASRTAPVPTGAIGAHITEGLLNMGLKDTAAVRLDLPAGLLLLDPQKHKMPMLMALSVASSERFLEALKPVWTYKQAAGGVHELLRHDVDTQDVFSKGAKALSDRPPSTLFVRFSRGVAYLAIERQVLELGSAFLESRLVAGAPQSGGVLAVGLANLRKSFAPQLAALPMMIDKQLRVSLGQRPDVRDPELALWMTRRMLDKSFALLGQTRQLSTALDLSAKRALIHLSLSAERDSSLARFLASQDRDSRIGLDAYLPPGGFLSMAANVQWMLVEQDLLAFAQELSERLAGPEGADGGAADGGEQSSRRLVDAIRKMITALGDELALTEDIGPDMAMKWVQVIALRDETAARESLDALVSLGDELMGAMDSAMTMGASFEGPRQLEPQGAVGLQAFEIRFQLAALPEQQAAWIRKMYGGDSLKMAYAIFDKKLALSMGRDAETELRALIDRLQTGKTGGIPDSALYKSAAGDLAPKAREAGCYVMLSFGRVLALSVASTFATMGDQAPRTAIPDIHSGFFLEIRSDHEEQIEASLRLPAEHLTEMGEIIALLARISVTPPQPRD